MFLFKPAAENSKEEYNPAKANYDPVSDANWGKGEPVPFSALAKTFAAIEENRSRLKSIELLANYLCSVMHQSPDDVVKSIYLCLNKVCPDYEGVELGNILPGMLFLSILTKCLLLFQVLALRFW